MRSLFLILLLLFINKVYSQNLIMNGSMEEYNVPCPTGLTIGLTPNQEIKNVWAIKLTPDFYNECVKISTPLTVSVPHNLPGYQWPRTGRGYGGFVNSIYNLNLTDTLGTEIITFFINDTLINGAKYNFRFFVSLADSMGYATDILEGVLSSQYTINIPDYISYYSIVSNTGKGIIDDMINWIEVSGIITATGKEKYIHIGRLHLMKSSNVKKSNTAARPSTFPDYDRLYYYIDDVALWSCDTIPPVAEAGNDTLICYGDSTRIGGHNYPDYYYSWWHDSICTQNGPTEIQRDEHQGKIWVKPTKSTWYYVQATDFKYDKSIDSVFVLVKNCNAAIHDTTICLGDEVLIGNGDPFFSAWHWSPPDFLDNPWSATPIARPTGDITYYVTATDTLGAKRLDSINISVQRCHLPPEIEIPNVITPNGDGLNDVFRFKNEEFWQLQTQIFNRWGNLIFTGNEQNHWDGTYKGKKVSEGVYFYHITAHTEGFDKVFEYRGTVTVFW